MRTMITDLPSLFILSYTVVFVKVLKRVCDAFVSLHSYASRAGLSLINDGNTSD